MKRINAVLPIVLAAFIFVPSLSTLSLAADKPVMAPSAKNLPVVQQPATTLVVCKDPAVSNFTVTKTLSGNVATFTMTGIVCNNGPGNYNQPDNILNAHFNVYAGYGPMFSYPAAGEVSFFKQPVGPILNKSECKQFTQRFTRNKVLQWGFREPQANEKQMKLLFEFFVRDAKGTLGTISQPKGLDCNTNNNLSAQTIEMMVTTTP